MTFAPAARRSAQPVSTGPNDPTARCPRALSRIAPALLLAACLLQTAAAAPAQAPLLTATAPGVASAGDATLLEAREAARRRELPRLAAARSALAAAQHPLALWADYWDLNARIKDATVDEVEAFYARWSGSYVEDRLRNDWLLELGRRRDFAALAKDYPRFRMNDDREVTCWWLLTEHLAGRDVTDAARRAWFAQRELDDGCNMLATALVDAKRFGADEVWRKARLALEGQRPGAAKAAVALLGGILPREAAEAVDNPARYLARSSGFTRNAHELRTLALMRLAVADLDAAVAQLNSDKAALPKPLAAWAWAYAARQAAFKLQPEAADHVAAAWGLLRGDTPPGFTDETLAWGLRAVLRAPPTPLRWGLVLRQIDAMSEAEQAEPTWTYWKARALQASAPAGAEGDAQREQARALYGRIAGALGFYPNLAADALGQRPALPPAPAALTEPEREAARRHPGLARALQMAALGLQDEARREWNFSLRGMADRELLAAARLACDASHWLLCINTAERAKGEVDVALRYPTPYAAEITQAAQAVGLEPAFVFGLIRQETRFMPSLRSSAGALGLMQVMPETGKWVARKVGLDPARLALSDPLTNLKLGTSYLKLVLDDLSGSQAMAAAAYNAGPGRPRRWREGGVVEAAAWAEAIPLAETREYVKRVLGNAAVYATLLDARRPTLVRPRLGERIGPRDATAPAANTELP